jgi:hypothetical protein
MKILRRWLGFAFLVAVLAGLLTGLVQALGASSSEGLTYLSPKRVDVWLDPETGCEYLLHGGTFQRRMKPDGHQLCDGGS